MNVELRECVQDVVAEFVHKEFEDAINPTKLRTDLRALGGQYHNYPPFAPRFAAAMAMIGFNIQTPSAEANFAKGELDRQIGEVLSDAA